MNDNAQPPPAPGNPGRRCFHRRQQLQPGQRGVPARGPAQRDGRRPGHLRRHGGPAGGGVRPAGGNIGTRPDHPGGQRDRRQVLLALSLLLTLSNLLSMTATACRPCWPRACCSASRWAALEPGRQHGQPTGAGRIGSPSHIGGLRRHLGRHRARRAAGHADRPGTGLAQCVRGRQRRLGAGLCGPVCQPAHRDAGDAHQRPPAVPPGGAAGDHAGAAHHRVGQGTQFATTPTSNPICPT